VSKSAKPPIPSISPLYPRLQVAVEYLPVGGLKSYERNARTHSKRQIEQLASSIAQFGFVSPLVIDQDGVLIAGHGRLEAAKKLGFAEVPVVQIDHLGEAEKKALRLADNQLASLAGWDQDLLALEFKDLLNFDLELDLDFDLTITGFASAEIDGIVEKSGSPSDEAEERVPELDRSQPKVSRLGDIWVLGEHRIICGNSVEENTYRDLLQGEKAAVGIHDFPYNVPINGHVSSSGRHREFVMAAGEMSPEQFTAFLGTVFLQTSRVLRPGALQFSFMDWRHMAEMLEAGRSAGLGLKNLCVWNKGCGGMGSLYRSQHELIFVYAVPGASHENNVQLGRFGRNRTNVWDYPGGAAALKTELALHSTPKPVAMIADAIRDCTSRNDLVLDAFSGSGTTIIAAAKSGRRARVIELDPHYVDVAVRRWELWADQVAVHATTGLSFGETAEARLREDAQSAASAGALPRVRQRTRPVV
jgi:DNA modification methylase